MGFNSAFKGLMLLLTFAVPSVWNWWRSFVRN